VTDWAMKKADAIFMEATSAVAMIVPTAQALREAYEAGRQEFAVECAKALSKQVCDFCQGTGQHLSPDVAEHVFIPCSKKGCPFVAANQDNQDG
jgi:hypothetical protein